VITPWAVYAFIIFEDASAEPDCDSFMLWHAVPAHLPLDEQCKPRAWLTIVIAARSSSSRHRPSYGAPSERPQRSSSERFVSIAHNDPEYGL
jgi:hypothetical protein